MTNHDTDQETYWELSTRRTKAEIELRDAEAALDSFMDSHPNQPFKVFRPEWIDAAFRDDIIVWDV